MNILESVLPSFGFNDESINLIPFGGGLINHTWKVSDKGNEYILQRVNDNVFTQPQNIASNIRLIADYFKANFPSYNFVAPLTTIYGEDLLYIPSSGYYRMFPFVAGSHAKQVGETPAQAYEAALQFGRFTKLLCNLDISNLSITIPSFHDLGLRYQQFLTALEKGNKDRMAASNDLIEQIVKYQSIVSIYTSMLSDTQFKRRVTHHDTKISNVLFDKEDKGLCVIDLDTVMPGYFISDVGDMLRTYLCPVSEEENDFSKIEVREEFYKAIIDGYKEEMKNELTDKENKYFFYAGKFMIYMQALRFLTDHINADAYYGAKYEGQNFVRASNQMVLLERYLEKEKDLGTYGEV
jgi:Ser/Thr protein kinase RdoA (MazF antagonist)